MKRDVKENAVTDWTRDYGRKYSMIQCWHCIRRYYDKLKRCPNCKVVNEDLIEDQSREGSSGIIIRPRRYKNDYQF